MVRAIVRLGLIGMLVLGAGGIAAAAAAQTLGVDVGAPQPSVDRLDRYTQGQPITLHVTDAGAHGATLLGVSPSGINLRLPLQRNPDGSYSGSLTPAEAGTWTLAIGAGTDPSADSTSTFTIVVAEPGASDAAAAGMVALAIASIGGGIGLISVGRRNAGSSSS